MIQRLEVSPMQARALRLALQGMTDDEIAVALHYSVSAVRYHMNRIRALVGSEPYGHRWLAPLAYALGQGTLHLIEI